MSAAPSRMLFGVIPWYSFLIVLGVVIAIVLAVREENRAGLGKDTVIDFTLGISSETIWHPYSESGKAVLQFTEL